MRRATATSIICVTLAAAAAGDLAYAEIIPAARRIDWSPGVPGGIPHYPVAYDVKADFGAVGDDVADDTQAFRNALGAAATNPGHAIYVPEGTYRVTGTLNIASGVVIRGAGPTRTLIHSQHSQTTFSIRGAAPIALTTLSAPAAKDAQTVQVVAADGLSAGDLVQLARPDEVAQIVEVAEVNGTQLSLAGTLYGDFPAASAVLRHEMVAGAGVEDMKILIDWPALNGGPGVYKVLMEYAARCWVRNIEATGFSGKEVFVEDSYRCEVRDSYFHQDLAEALTKTRFDVYGVELGWATSDTLVENNILNRYRHAMVVQNDNAGGNVFGYNMSWVMFTHNDATGVLARSFIIGDIEFHHRQIEQALFEGNHAELVRLNDSPPDYDKVSNTLLRNRITQSGISAGDGNNFVGNELPPRKLPLVDDDLNIIRTRPEMTELLIHGNYIAHENQGLQWDPLIDDQVIPASYYLTEKPEWFGDLQWPAFGGDLMPNNTRRSPAEVRFWTMQFPEVAPSGLTLTVQGSEVHLSWTNQSTNPVDFVVVRSSDGSGFERIAETTATTYVDDGYTPGEPRWYYVRARNHLGGEDGDELGGESDPSNVVSTEDAAFSLSLANCASSEGNAGSSTCTFDVMLQALP